MVLGVGGTTHTMFGVMVDLLPVLEKFVFCFLIKRPSSKIGRFKDDLVEIFAKIWDTLSYVQNRGNMGQMSLDIL